MLISSRFLWALLLLVLGIRLATLGAYPLMDTSEARYAEMARKMVVLNDWVTPMFDVGVPFWGKPPLSFWTQALSIKLFGLSEFAVRLPAWLFHVASCALIINLAVEARCEKTGLLAAIIYTSSVLGMVAGGVVLTDPALVFAVLAAFWGFWIGMTRQGRHSPLIGFAGLGIGLLAKGPLILALFAIPAIAWTAWHHQWAAFRRLPWGPGIVIVMMIALPWYIAAEAKTPGFLEYFFIGEHWHRYVISDWNGDLYGDAHAEPYGTIWVYLALALLPWSVFLPVIWRRRRMPPEGSWQATMYARWRSFLWLWALFTPAFFTLSGNILSTYLLPALPAWSLLLAEGFRAHRRIPGALFGLLALAMPTTLVGVTDSDLMRDRKHNQQDVIAYWRENSNHTGHPLFYLHRSYAAEFYSRGDVTTVRGVDDMPQGERFYLAIPGGDAKADLSQRWACESLTRINDTQLLYCGSES